MRYAVLADIHANLTAFQAVLADANARGGFEAIWCLGDMVGYGPDPHECLSLLHKYEHVCVAGNHDLAAIGAIDTSDFNPMAAAANRWTAGQLTAEDVHNIEKLPLTLVRDDFTLAHGSPRQPVWEYLVGTAEAIENFSCFETPYCLVGHTHAPLVFQNTGGRCVGRRLRDREDIPLGHDRLIINPGGVGQPRDGDHRAAYALYDSTSRILSCYRVEYDIPAVQQRMQQHGLPTGLIARLGVGW